MKKRIIAIGILLCILVSICPQIAASQSYELLYETKEDGKTYITGYTGILPSTLTIPSEIDGVEIYGVYNNAFSSANIQTLYIGVKVICEYAFHACSIQTLVGLEGLEEIGVLAFEFNWSLKNVNLPSSLRRIEDGAFSCTGLSEITLPEGLTHLGSGVFAVSQIKEITLPTTLVSYQDFEKSSSIELVRAYPNVALQQYCEQNGLLFYNLETGELTELPYEVVVGNLVCMVYPYSGFAAVTGCKGNGGDPLHLVIPEQVDGQPVTEIRYRALSSLNDLVSVYIPDTVTTIGSHAFTHSFNLAHVRMSENLKTIGENAFYATQVQLLYLPPSFEHFDFSHTESLGDVRVIAGYRDSYAYTVAMDTGTDFFAMDEETQYLFGDNGLYYIDGDEAAAACVYRVLVTDGIRCLYIPDEIDGHPLTRVDEGAIYAEYIDLLILGNHVEVVEAGTLTGTHYPVAMYIPPSVRSIADAPGPDCITVIYGVTGSYAQTYARTHGLEFYDLDTSPFLDVSPDSWYHDYVRDAYWNGLMNGTSETTFEPNGIASRAMVVQVLFNMSGGESLSFNYGFWDVSPENWYFSAVNWGRYYGIVQGTSATHFSPNAPVTREQFATFLFRYAKACGLDCSAQASLSQYNDRSRVSDYAYEAISWAVAIGVINGSSPNTLSPQNYATRAELAAMLCRFLDWAT